MHFPQPTVSCGVVQTMCVNQMFSATHSQDVQIICLSQLQLLRVSSPQESGPPRNTSMPKHRCKHECVISDFIDEVKLFHNSLSVRTITPGSIVQLTAIQPHQGAVDVLHDQWVLTSAGTLQICYYHNILWQSGR